MTGQIALIIMGVIICLAMRSIKNKYRNLLLNGNKVDGTLLRYEMGKVKNNQVKIPVVQFTTHDNQTLTLQSPESFFSSYAKLGSKVNVFYDPSNPKEFIIQGKKFKSLYVTVIAGGVVFIITGIVLLLNQLEVIHLIKK